MRKYGGQTIAIQLPSEQGLALRSYSFQRNMPGPSLLRICSILTRNETLCRQMSLIFAPNMLEGAEFGYSVLHEPMILRLASSCRLVLPCRCLASWWIAMLHRAYCSRKVRSWLYRNVG